MAFVVLQETTVMATAPPTTKATERPIKILNESGSKVEIYWIHPQTGALTIMSSPNVLNGASFNLNSFIGHEFEIRELPSSKTGVCKGNGNEQTCRTNHLAVTENSEQSKWSVVGGMEILVSFGWLCFLFYDSTSP
jgi:hypothetical protein